MPARPNSSVRHTWNMQKRPGKKKLSGDPNARSFAIADRALMCWIRPTVRGAAVFVVFHAFVASLPADDAKGSPPRSASQQALPSEQRCRDWAALFEKAVRSGDLTRCNDLIDSQAILETAAAFPNPSPEQAKKRAEFIEGLKPKFASGFAGQMIATVRDPGSFKLLRLRDVDGRRRAQFRALTKENGLNYYEFILAPSTDRSVRAVDLYVVAMAQLQSENLRPWFLTLMHSPDAGAQDQLNPTERDIVRYATDVVAMRDAARARQPRRVLEIYDRLPESLKRTKALLSARLASAALVSEADYLRAFDDFQKYYPNEAGSDLIALNGFFVRKSYERALASVDRLDKALGGDPYLKVTRAIILLEQGKAEASRKMAERAIVEEPTLFQAYEFLINHSIQTRNFAKTTELLSTVESKFNWKAPDLTTDPACAEFVKSEEYKAWLKSRRGGK
jgi:hypothetical protein